MNSNAQSSNRDSSTATYKKQEKKQDTSATSSSNMSADKKANGSDASTSSKETLTDRVMMKDDKMYIVKNNESAILDKNYKLSNGVFVTADGSVNYPGGKTVKLKNGQFIELTPQPAVAPVQLKLPVSLLLKKHQELLRKSQAILSQ